MGSALGNVSTKVSAEIDKIVGMLGQLILSTSEGRGDCANATRQLAISTDQEAVRAISDALIKSLRAIELQQEWSCVSAILARCQRGDALDRHWPAQM